jgi:hypothetical protein
MLALQDASWVTSTVEGDLPQESLAMAARVVTGDLTPQELPGQSDTPRPGKVRADAKEA